MTTPKSRIKKLEEKHAKNEPITITINWDEPIKEGKPGDIIINWDDSDMLADPPQEPPQPEEPGS